MLSDDHGLQPQAGPPQPQADRVLDRWGRWLKLGANIGVVAGPVVDAVDDNFLADYLDSLKLQLDESTPTEAPPAEPETTP